MAAQAWVSELQTAKDITEQIVILRSIKNGIVGHPVAKEIAVTQGVLEPVVRLANNKSSSREDSEPHEQNFASRSLVEDEVIRLQGLQIISSIALGGPAFLSPLQSTSVLPAIISNICPSISPPQLVLAALQALSNITASSTLAPDSSAITTTLITEHLFTRENLSSLAQILSQTSSSSVVQTQIAILASLVSKLCFEERHQQALANSGILDALATKLASFIVAGGLVIPGAELLAQRDGLQEHFPTPAPSTAKLSVILQAIAAIIATSKLRASQFLYSPSILAVLPSGQSIEHFTTQNTRATRNAFNTADLSARQNQLNAVDFLLPLVPSHSHKSGNIHFPALGSSGSRENLVQIGNTSAGTSFPYQDSTMSDIEEPESPMIAYLIVILRSRTGYIRLAAASVLTVLYKAGLVSKTKESAIGSLVVPLLVESLEEPRPLKSTDPFMAEKRRRLICFTREKAPSILAMLIADNEYLQKAAFDAGAINNLSKLLRLAYDPVDEFSSSQIWSPNDTDGRDNTAQPAQLGQSGQHPLLLHKIRIRESSLKAIASIVSFKDEYRKVIVERGMIPFIVESMNSNPGKPIPRSNDKSEKVANGSGEVDIKQGYGTNTLDVMIAACGAIRALSRSVSILRTTLIDNGIAAPVIRLLRHPDIEIQIAATATMCNLVTDISPMRDVITEAGVVKILCEHAHSMNARLRLNALWALKHFVNAADNSLKRLCVEELGQGWLVQLICDDTEDEALLSSRDKAEKGDSANEETDEDVEMDQFEDQVDAAFAGSFGKSTISRPSSSRSKSIQQAELRLAALRDAETNPKRKARKDDIAVQEQGLSFIRNLIGPTGPGASSEVTEMVDFLFNSLGQERVFEILESKLRPRVVNPFGRRSTAETRIQPAQPEIIVAVAMILVHMAASVPRHRQIVIAQTDLLKLLVLEANHPNIEIRLALCHLAMNLTWVDGDSDTPACAQRARELMKLGFLSKLESLEADPELNVRERAKAGVFQMKKNLGFLS